MTHHPIITGALLGVAVALAIVCSIGLAVMRDAYQRLHYSSAVVLLCVLLVAVAVFIEDSDSQARFKVVLIYILMLLMNAVLNHATARAIRIRQTTGETPPPAATDDGAADFAARAGGRP